MTEQFIGCLALPSTRTAASIWLSFFLAGVLVLVRVFFALALVRVAVFDFGCEALLRLVLRAAVALRFVDFFVVMSFSVLNEVSEIPVGTDTHEPWIPLRLKRGWGTFVPEKPASKRSARKSPRTCRQIVTLCQVWQGYGLGTIQRFPLSEKQT